MTRIRNALLLFVALSGSAQAIVVPPPSDEAYWRIDESPLGNGYWFQVTNGHPSGSIVAFAVGTQAFNPVAMVRNEAGWSWGAAAVTEDEWGTSNPNLPGGVSFMEFFGNLEWNEVFIDSVLDFDNAVAYWGNAGSNMISPTATVGVNPYENGADQAFYFLASRNNSPSIVLLSDGTTALGPANAHNPFPTPEPASLALFGIGIAGLGFRRRRQSNQV